MAKQNRRRRTGRKPPSPTAFDVGSGDPTTIAEAIIAAAARGGAESIGPVTVTDELAAGAELAGGRLIAHAFDLGWRPTDIHHAARRRLGEFALGYLTDLMAAHRLDPLWESQLDDLAAAVWWTPPHLRAWADRALLTGDEALTTVIEALGLLARLPRLESTGPVRPRHGVDDKVLGRVRGLLAKAESTSFPDEAEALSAKAQELITKYAIDHLLLEPSSDLPATRRIWLDTPYTDAKALLIDRVAHANRCRAIFAAEWGFVTVVGDDTDLDLVELLSTSLLVQATRTMIDTADSGETRSRHYRKAFLTAYATRIGDRLTEAADATIAHATDRPDLLPALASHRQQLDRAFDTYFPTARAKGITIRSEQGWDAGTTAADHAHFGRG
ncbi:DUF2786 domain-containing protein [Nocardia caishijiensis]|uniref:Uncharacterized protein DUF2786 n=1 Tax=Nocardia caishijiensis TaxID=184756 RepID=A0ABQ6YGV6_9NOCA|nr:DUF2786 domain-containing protein [Nocardia caishijiensis]KAF0845020.1 uncharacterized protein DUF2786 [Nocardia caishijiensis]